MGNLQASGGGRAGLNIVSSPRKIYSQVISSAIFLGGVCPTDPVWNWAESIRSGKNIFL